MSLITSFQGKEESPKGVGNMMSESEVESKMAGETTASKVVPADDPVTQEKEKEKKKKKKKKKDKLGKIAKMRASNLQSAAKR